MEWYLWVLISYFGIGVLFSLIITFLIITKRLRLQKYSTLKKIYYLIEAIFIWPYVLYIILGGK
jgi:maltodextrin utilization protein YvdJ